MRKEARRYRKRGVTPQEPTDGLFLCYLIATAPFIDLNDYNNVEWVSEYTDVDHTVKEFMSNTIPFIALTDKQQAPEQGRSPAVLFKRHCSGN